MKEDRMETYQMELLIKELTYQGITYSLNDPVNNYTSLRKLLKADDQWYDFHIFKFDSDFTHEFEEDETWANFKFKNVQWYDDLVFTRDKNESEVTGIYYKYNTQFRITNGDYCWNPMITILEINNDSPVDPKYDSFSSQDMREFMEWGNKLKNDGRLTKSPKLCSYSNTSS